MTDFTEEDISKSEMADLVQSLRLALSDRRDKRFSAYIDPTLTETARGFVGENELFASESVLLDAALRHQIHTELHSRPDYELFLDHIPDLEERLTTHQT